MAKNVGKIFESHLMESIGKEWFTLRLKDTGGWSNATNTSFSSSNIADFIVFNEGKLYICELKSTKGTSVPIPRQHLGLIKIDRPGVFPVYIINFREKDNRTFVVKVKDAQTIFDNKKSINLNDCASLGIEVENMIIKPNRTKITYLVKKALSELK